MSVKNNVEMRYDAFISYRHSELDKFVAEELHKQLENFKIPKNIAKQSNKKKINRIFRDKDELPITSNLADPILNALQMSEYLIVICSPRLKESLWCKREIENFISMHGQEKILAVLIEGEPSESFPEELLYREKTITNANGETTVIKEPVEPLAADVRGKNKKEVKKLIKTEMLRLLASMLGCHYDDLKQRHKERKMKRMLALAAVVCFVGIAFGTVSSIMALKIHNQKEQIDKQYWEALKTNAQMGSEKALELLESGDRITAIQMAKDLLPEDFDNQNIPYTAEAYYALTESLYSYAMGDVIRPVFKIKENAEIKEMALSNDSNKIYVRTKYDKLTVWDIPNKKICMEIDMNKLGYIGLYEDNVSFLGEDKIAIMTSDEILIFDLEDNKDAEVSQRISNGDHMYVRRVIGDRNGKYIVSVFETAVCVYDAESGALLHEFEAPENMEVQSDDILFRGAKEFILIYGSDILEEEKADFEFRVMDLETGNMITQFNVPQGRLAAVDVAYDAVYVAVNGDNKELVSIFDTVDDAMVYCYDAKTGAKRWEHYVEEEFINRIVVPYQDYECFLFESYAQITALDAKTGELVGRFGFSGTITEIFPLQTPDSYVVFTKDGRRVNFIPKQNYNVENVGKFVAGTTSMQQIEWGNAFLASLPYSSKEVIVYGWYEDEGMETVLEFDSSLSNFVVSENGKYSVVETYDDELLIIDNKTREIIGSTTFDSYAKGLHFIEGDKIQRVSGDDVFIYDLQGELVEQYSIEDMYISIEYVSKDGKNIFADDFENLYVMDAATLKETGKIAKDECEYDENCTYAFSNNGDICVIIDKAKGQFRSYDVEEGSLLYTVDINATYIEKVIFAENDKYVYFLFEDGLVSQYVCDTMEHKCDVEGLDSITDDIIEKEQDGESVYYFDYVTGMYMLKDYEGQLKLEQDLERLEGIVLSQNEYWFVDYSTLVVFPIYSYEEMLGKADQICYDNSLWNNN